MTAIPSVCEFPGFAKENTAQSILVGGAERMNEHVTERDVVDIGYPYGLLYNEN